MATLDAKDLGLVLEAAFHYGYKANNGKYISFDVGDEFILIKKSNSDWWQVIKQNEKKPFYVPAAYMKELDRHVYPDHPFFRKAYANLQKQKKKLQETGKHEEKPQAAPRKKEAFGSRENLTELSSKSKFSSVRASCDSLDRFIEQENPYDEVPYAIPAKDDPVRGLTREHKEEPDYENLEKIQSHISESRLHVSPPVAKRERNLPSEPLPFSDKHPPTIDHSQQDPRTLYANLSGEEVIQPRIPHEQPLSTTTVEILEDGWELQLDNQSNSRYYLNSQTGEMRVKPPRKSVGSPTTKSLNKRVSAIRVVPPAPPDVSKKPTLQRSNLSPKLDEPESEVGEKSGNRRSSLPEIIDEGPWKASQDTETKSNTLQSSKMSYMEPIKNKNDSNNVERHFSFKDRFFSSKSKHKKTNSESLPQTFTKSTPLSSPTLSSDDLRIKPSPWIRETSPEGDPVYIQKSNGERWRQMLDNNTGNYYYCNEHTNETAWQLPEHDAEIFDDLNQNEIRDEDRMLIENSVAPKDLRTRKASTIERDTLPEAEDSFTSSSNPIEVAPAVSAKPRKSRGFRKQADRVMMARSMIVLPDSRPNLLSVEEAAQFGKLHFRHQREPVSFPLPHPMIEKQGRLNWTKLMEAGKKQKKNWVQQWVVLLANNLLFYKDQKQATMTKASPHGKPDSSCDLRGSTVDWANDKSSKKNVIELRTFRGLSLLLQHDDIGNIQRWLTAIRATIERANQIDGDDIFLQIPTTTEDDEEVDSKKKKDKKKKQKPMRHGSDVKSTDNVRTRLRKFITRRPPIESLQERGIIKETVFGCPLAKLCERENDTVPSFVKLCVEEVERRGLDVDGIYRVSGNLSHVQKLRYLIDRDENVELADVQWEDIHLITGALKMFLRELPEPVIPFDFFDKFVAACKISDDNQRIEAMTLLVSVLPRVNGDTLRFLMQHFCKQVQNHGQTRRELQSVFNRDINTNFRLAVSSPTRRTAIGGGPKVSSYIMQDKLRVVHHSSKNRMQVQNIAIVFGPTLLLKPPDNSKHDASGESNMAVYMVYQNQIIDEMLTNYDRIFG